MHQHTNKHVHIYIYIKVAAVSRHMCDMHKMLTPDNDTYVTMHFSTVGWEKEKEKEKWRPSIITAVYMIEPHYI